jgi:general secretion pathway protein D
LPRFTSATFFFALVAATLGACSLNSLGPGDNGIGPPDAIERVRATDLEPRFPRTADNVNTGSSNGPRPQTFFGSGTASAPPSGRTAAAANEGEGFALNFENTPVSTVAKVVLGDLLGVGYTIDPRAQGTISLSSGRPVPKAEMLFVLESALRASNLVLVRDTSGYRIVPASDAMGSGAVDRADSGNRPEAGYGVTVIPLQHVSVQTISKLLEGFATKTGTIRADPNGNMLIVTGNGLERRAAVETVLSFDVDWMRGQSVGIFPVQNTTPEPLLAELEKILDTGEGGLSQSLVKFLPIARLNAILVVARKPELLRSAGNWISRLDKSETASTGVKVYHVRYGDARQLAKLLTDLFIGGGSSNLLDSPTNQIASSSGVTSLSAADRLGGGSQSQSGSGLAGGTQSQSPFGALRSPGTGGAAAGDASANSLSSSASSALRGGSGGSGQAILPGVRITPDIVNNAILIYANQENYRIIERTLNQLDRPQLQVAIELTIAEVTLNDSLNYGVQFFLRSKDFGLPSDKGSVVNATALGSKTSGTLFDASTVATLAGRTVPGANFLLGPENNPRVIIDALHGYTDVKVLSNPSLVVVDNQPATLQVGDQVPTSTGSANVLTTSNTIVNTIDYKNTGIILRVQPRINSNGNVLLDVEQEISNVAASSTNSTGLTPTISQRKVKSSILVASGQTVLLAGLISDTVNNTRSGIPVLDSLPLVGDAFATNGKTKARTELIIFIRPQIIRDSVDASYVAEELRSKMMGGKIGSVQRSSGPKFQ